MKLKYGTVEIFWTLCSNTTQVNDVHRPVRKQIQVSEY